MIPNNPPQHRVLTQLLALAVAITVQAQTDQPAVVQEDLPVECLWSANESTRGALDITPDQVKRLEAIRQRYPAPSGQPAIDGTTPKRSLPDRRDDPRIQPWIDERGQQTPSAGSTPPPAVEPLHPDAAALAPMGTPEDLQAELRQVLKPDQLRQWRALCNWQTRD